MTEQKVQRQGTETALTVRDVRDELEMIRTQIEEVLPTHIDPDRFLRVVTAAVLRSPDLLKADRLSLLRAVHESAQLGLEPTGLLGSAYLIPYNVKGKPMVQLIPGYRGLIDLARRSGEIESIYAHVVHERDVFAIRQGTDPGIDHQPFVPPATDPAKDIEGHDPGKIIGAYMVAVLRDRSGMPSVRQIEWMTYAEIEAVRKRSRAGHTGPWVSDWPEMARKTVVRRGAKYLPLTPEAERAFSLDERAEHAADPVSPKRQSARSAVLEAMAERSGVEVPPDAEEGSATEAASDEVIADVCGEVPPEDELGLTEPCFLAPHEKGSHRSSEGSWPR